MNTKEYIQKYNLDKSDKFNHSAFVEDLTEDFIALLEMNKALDNIKGFENALRCVRMKFDAVSNKTRGMLSDKLWNFFYATQVVKLRDEMCPKEMESRLRQKEERERQREAYRKMYSYEDDFFANWFKERAKVLADQLYGLLNPVPTESFQILGLTETATTKDILSKFRELAMKHHPDKGGKQEKFIQITTAKNKCIAWADENSDTSMTSK
jgi:hypothetical protein